MDTLLSSALSEIPGINHGFGTLRAPVPAPFDKTWDLHPTKTQVHGVAIAEATEPKTSLGEVDSVITRAPGIMAPIMTADCTPILMARKDGQIVTGTHAGWRGTRAGALKVLWDRLRSEGQDPRDWVAAIGPTIGPCCYEVSEDLAADFEKEFARFGQGLAVPAHRRLDLPAINEAMLKEIGVSRVELLRACTHCARDEQGEFRFNSYRRQSGARQWSVIARKN